MIKANTLVGPRRLEMQEFPRPDIGRDDALLRVELCGICGSDVELFRGAVGADFSIDYPMIPGHEPVGVIDQIGEDAAQRWGVKVGDRVAIEPAMRCGFCRPCILGDYRLCVGRRPGLGYGHIPTSVAPSLWGGYAEYLYLHPKTLVHRVPEPVSLEEAVLYNALSGAISWAVLQPRLARGETIVILGPGQRGLAAVIAARDAGAGMVIVTGGPQDAARLDVAVRLGADLTLFGDAEDVVERVREFTGGRMADVVLDVSSGDTKPIVQAVQLVRPGGRVVLAGLKGHRPVEGLISDDIVLGQVTMTGVLSVGYRAFEAALALLASGRHDMTGLLSHRFSIAEAEQAISVLSREVHHGTDPLFVCIGNS